MPLQLVFEDQWSIPVPMDDRLQEALGMQRERGCRDEFDVAFIERLSISFANVLAECLDADLQLPTDSQVKYALDIARELGVSLPADALRFRGLLTNSSAGSRRHSAAVENAAADRPSRTTGSAQGVALLRAQVLCGGLNEDNVGEHSRAHEEPIHLYRSTQGWRSNGKGDRRGYRDVACRSTRGEAGH